MSKAFFGSGFFRFFRELTLNNEREWFLANKERYETDVKAPMLAFLEALRPKMAKLAPRFVVDAKPNGGSMMRIYRDIRFSKDKTPYKTNAAAHFWHRDCEAGGAPGYYFHLDAKEGFAGGGLWHPEPATVVQVRQAIVKSPAAWKKAKGRIALEGESLKKAPRGYDPEHPLAEDLKRKDFVASSTFKEREACAPRFDDKVVSAFAEIVPLMKFLTASVGLHS